MAEALKPGDPHTAGPYQLLARLGAGGMGQVFLGRSPGGRPVAVKVIRPELLAGQPSFRARFAREVAAARRVSALYTAPVVDADPDAEMPWLVTAYVAGPSLADAVIGHEPLRAEVVRALAAALAEGLGQIHAAGVVHRDLKPANVLLAADGPRIIDFGISRAVEASALTGTGLIVGSPAYMSPEQAGGEEAGPPSDVFSLGCVLAFAATGAAPFKGETLRALLFGVITAEPDLSGLPASLAPLVRRCLAKKPAQRPAPGEIVAELGPAGLLHDWLPPAVAAALPGYSPAALGVVPQPGTGPGAAQAPAAAPPGPPGGPATRSAAATQTRLPGAGAPAGHRPAASPGRDPAAARRPQYPPPAGPPAAHQPGSLAGYRPGPSAGYRPGPPGGAGPRSGGPAAPSGYQPPPAAYQPPPGTYQPPPGGYQRPGTWPSRGQGRPGRGHLAGAPLSRQDRFGWLSLPVLLLVAAAACTAPLETFYAMTWGFVVVVVASRLAAAAVWIRRRGPGGLAGAVGRSVLADLAGAIGLSLLAFAVLAITVDVLLPAVGPGLPGAYRSALSTGGPANPFSSHAQAWFFLHLFLLPAALAVAAVVVLRTRANLARPLLLPRAARLVNQQAAAARLAVAGLLTAAALALIGLNGGVAPARRPQGAICAVAPATCAAAAKLASGHGAAGAG